MHFLRAGESESGVFGAGAAWRKSQEEWAAKKFAGSSALREDKKNKEIALCLLFFR